MCVVYLVPDETVFNPAFYILIPLLALLLILVAVYALRRTCKRTHVDVDPSVAFFAPPAGVRNLKFEKREPAEEMPGQEVCAQELGWWTPVLAHVLFNISSLQVTISPWKELNSSTGLM